MRRKKNLIPILNIDDGLDFYTKLFSYQAPNFPPEIKELFLSMNFKKQNAFIASIPSPNEIKEAL